MPKNLILVRHAKSDWSISGQKDIERGLNERGLRDAPKMAMRFAARNIPVHAIVCSTAVRTVLTCEYFAERLKIPMDSVIMNAEIYEASLRILLREINLLDNAHSNVMLIGHNPGFTYLAEHLTKENITDFPTCGVMHVSLLVDDWQEVSGGIGKIELFDYP
ncbi:MAG: histidine phosphatase family protein [Cytophagales bacterium]|nr:histidine phosphatase family protein [Cytophagales bacterium]